MRNAISRSTADAVLAGVAARHRMRVFEFVGNGGRLNAPACAARAEAAFIFRYEYGLSYPQTAKHVGFRDHTSAVHAVWLHRERLGDPEAIEFLRKKRVRHLEAFRRRAPRPKRKVFACSLSDKMRQRLNSANASDVAMALRYFVEWDGERLRWTRAGGSSFGMEVREKISRGSPGRWLVRSRILWIILTGSSPRWFVRYKQQRRPICPETVYCLGESLADYLKRVPEYGSQYCSPRRPKRQYRHALPVLPKAHAIGRSASADARSSGPAQIPPPA